MQIILYKIRTLYILITFLKDSFSFLSSSIPSLIASLSENLWITLPLNRRSNQRATDQTSELYIFLPTGSIFIPQRAINQTTELYIFMLTGSIFIPWRQRRWIILKRKGKKQLYWYDYYIIFCYREVNVCHSCLTQISTCCGQISSRFETFKPVCCLFWKAGN